MLKSILLAVVAVVTSLTFSVEDADAFGGRGYARRQARRAVYHAHHHVYRAPVVAHRVYAAPVVKYYRAPVVYHAPVVSYYRAPVYHPPVSVHVGRYGSYYGGYGGGVSVRVGW